MNSPTHHDSDAQLGVAIRSAFADIGAAADRPGRTGAGDQSIEAVQGGRRWLSVAAVALLVAGAAGLVLASERREVNDTATSVQNVGPSSEISWREATDVRSIAGSSVHSLVGNGTGFVAAGSRLSDGNTLGRVWFSADGLAWVEPTGNLFDSMTIVDAAATDDAFYVLATPDVFDLSQDEEGTTAGGNHTTTQIYRSVNGTDWTVMGGPDTSTLRIFGAGSTLLRETGQYSLEWTDNGEDWFASELPADEQWARFFTHPYGYTDAEATYVLGARSPKGTETDEWTIWSSLDDGRTWTRLPAPPVTGRPTSMIETPDGLLVSFAPANELCERVPNDSAGQDGKEPLVGDEVDNASLQCAPSLGLVRLDPGTGQWSLLDPIDSGPISSFFPVSRLRDTLVTPILEPDNQLTVWTSSLEANDWAPDPTTTVGFGNNTGSIEPVTVAVSNGTVVIARPQQLADSNVFLVGTTS